MASKPPETSKINGKKSAVAALIALIGVTAGTGLLTSTKQDEGEKLVAYRDIVGVLTICSGDTYNVRPGMVETKAGCEERTAVQVLNHVRPVMACIPGLKDQGLDYTRWAFGSFAYNLGPGRVCNKNGAIYKAGIKKSWVTMCHGIRHPAFATAKGRYIRGLDLRRRREEQICLTGLLPQYTPANLRQRLSAIR